jgi:hypothetical protein
MNLSEENDAELYEIKEKERALCTGWRSFSVSDSTVHSVMNGRIGQAKPELLM